MNDSIFRPNYTISSRIETSIEDIKRSAWLVKNMLIMPKHETWIRRNVSVQRAAGTTRIEGANMDEEEVRDMIRKAPKAAPSEDERANRNALRAYEFVDYLSDQSDLPINQAMIRQINREFMLGFPDNIMPGVYRTGEIKIGAFTPPNQGDVPGHVSAFTQWLQEESELHPILRAGLAHIQLVAIHPFWDGNGRTARALATLIMQRSQFDFKKLLSLEGHIFAIRDEYLTAIERTLGSEFSTDYDATPWLEFFTTQLSAHSSNLTDVLTDWHRVMDRIYAAMSDSGLNYRQEDGVIFARQTGKITRADYIEITDASPSTASRDLASLVEKGFLIAKGERRARVYFYRDEDAEAIPAGDESKQPRLMEM